MKKILLINVLMFCAIHMFGQLIPNGNFTTWINKHYYDYPNHWIVDVDGEHTDLLVNKVSNDAQHGTKSIKLNTLNIDNDINVGVLLYGIPDEELSGLPYNGIANRLNFWYKGNFVGNDKGFVWFILYANGVKIDSLGYEINTSTNNWTQVSININPNLIQPDSLFLAFISSKPDWMVGDNPEHGTWLMIDNISFSIGTTPIAQQLPNSSLEDWSIAAAEDPEFWSSSNSNLLLILNDTVNVTKSTNAYSSPYSAKLQVIELMGFTADSRLRYKNNNFPYQPDSISFYYKYFPNGQDTAIVSVNFFKNEDIVGVWHMLISNTTTNWTKSVPYEINYWGETPNRVEIRVDAGFNNGSTFYIDDVKFSCIKPKNIFGEFTSSSNISASWAAGALENEWQIQWGLSGFNLGSGTIQTISNNPTFNISGVNDNNSYDIYVRAICGTNEISNWTGPFTVCKSQSIPIFENFENTANGLIPSCWNKISNNWSFVEVQQGNPYSGNNHLRMNYWNDSPCYFISPQIGSNINNLYISLWAKHNHWGANQRLVIGTMSNPGDENTFSAQATYALAGNYQKIEHFFVNYTGTDKFIAIKLLNDDWGTEANLDDILIDFLPPCIPPQNIQFTSITTNSATVTWDAGGQNLWKLKYGTIGFDPTSQGQEINNITTNSVNLTSLQSGTSYDVYMQTDCGLGTISSWSKKGFATVCASFNVPIIENFSSTPMNSIPNCWSRVIQGWGEAYVVSWGGNNTPNSMNMRLGSIYDTVYFITPEIVQDLKDLSISFDAYTYAGNPTLTLGTINNSNDISSFVPISQINLTQNYQNYNILLNNYSGTHKKLAFRLFTIQTNYTEIFIDNVKIDYPPTCFPPQNIHVQNITSAIAEVTWQPGANETMWNLIYVSSWNDPFTQGTLIQNIDTTSYNLSGLWENYSYDVYLQSNCGNNDLSTWSNKYTFNTPCNPVFAPYTKNFDNYGTWEIPYCWRSHRYHLAFDSYVGILDNSPYSNYNHLYLLNGTSFDANGILSIVTPKLSDVNNKQISFWAKASHNGTPLIIGYQTDQNNTFATQITTLNLSTSYTEYTILLNNLNGDYYINLSHGEAELGNNKGIYIDNFTFDYAVSCPKPTNLQVSNIQPNSAKLHWQAGGQENEWNVIVVLSNTTDTVFNQIVNTDTITATGLSTGLFYSFYVKANCAAQDHSVWSGPLNFRAACLSYATPFIESFQGQMFPPLCWSRNQGSGFWKKATNAGGYNTSTYSAIADFYNISGNNPFDLMTFDFNSSNLSSPYLYFDFAYTNFNDNQYFDKLEILYSTDAGQNFSLLRTMNGNAELKTAPSTGVYFTPLATDWQSIDIPLPIGTNKVIFRATSGWGNNLYLDNIKVDEAPLCPTPVNFTTIAISTDTAHVEWLNTSSSYEIEFGIHPHVFTGVANITNINSNSYIFENLAHSTKYEYRVKNICGTNLQSNWSTTASFTTNCSSNNYMYEDFDNLQLGLMPICWTAINTHISSGFVGAHSSMSSFSYPYHLLLWNGNNPDQNAKIMAITPEISGINQKQIRFFGKTNIENSVLQVGTVTNPSDLSTFSLLKTFNLTTDYQEYYVSLSAAVSGHKYFVFKQLNSTSGNEEIIAIDNFVLEDLATCPYPTLLKHTALSQSTVSIEWTENGSANNWEIEWGNEWFMLGSGTNLFTTNNPLQISGLTPNTNYHFYVRSVCGGGDSSQWVGPYAFKTHFMCVQNSIHGQELNPIENFLLASSDYDSRKLLQSFSNVNSQFDGIHLWGVQIFYDGNNFSSCSSPSYDLKFEFFTDNQGMPGNMVKTFIVNVVGDSTLANFNGYQILEFSAQFPEIINMNNGWFSVSVINSPSCYLWFGTTYNLDAQGTLFRVIGSDFNLRPYPLAYCFTNNIKYVTYQTGNGGSLAGQMNQDVPYNGKTTSILAVPDPCFEFLKWSDNRTDNPRVDSLITTNLNISAIFTLKVIENHINATICQGQTYYIRNNAFTTTGNHSVILSNSNSCDSTVYLNLTVNPTYLFTNNQTICQGQTYSWRGNTYSIAGTYYDSLQTAQNCDSIYVLNLTVNPTYLFTQNQTICQGQTYSWRGNTYSIAGTYYDSLQTAQNCDSIYVLSLTVNPTYLFTQNQTICQGQTYSWRGNTYSIAGTYYDSLLTTQNCDSIYVLSLTITPVDTSVTQSGVVLTANATNATFQWIDCGNNNAIIPGENSNIFTATANGLYAVIVTQNNCSDTSSCYNITTVESTLISSENKLKVYPNPSKGDFIIEAFEQTEIRIYDAIGKIKLQQTLYEGKNEIKLINMPVGIYYIKADSRTRTETIKIVIHK